MKKINDNEFFRLPNFYVNITGQKGNTIPLMT